MIRKISAVYFSPTENTKKIATFLALYIRDAIVEKCAKAGNEETMDIPIEFVDFTLQEQRLDMKEFSSDELVIFAVPVYAGRVPNKILPFVQSLFKGNHTVAVPIVTFGNRSFDNALKELAVELDNNGFLSIGAAAIVGQHAFSEKLATGRPNEADMADLQVFAKAIGNKVLNMISSGNRLNAGDDLKKFDRCPLDRAGLYLDMDEIPGEWPLEKYYTPLGVDGKPAMFLKAKPKTRIESCDGCGICANVCPMGSISKDDFSQVDGICIKCHACITACPENAKYFDDAAFLSHVKMLELNYARRTESQFFV